MRRNRNFLLAIILTVILALPKVAVAGEGGELSESKTDKLIQDAQNPIANLVSVPFQNNFNLGFGPKDDLQYVMNLQPVMPIHLPEDWILIVRHILPIMSQPWPLARGGIGDLTTETFVTTPQFGPYMFGIGPAIEFPTASYEELGGGKFAAGPGLVAVYMKGKIMGGALLNNLWSFTGNPKRDDLSVMTFQPFVCYNLPKGWYLSSAPIMTANWYADKKDRWTLPLGGGLGKLVILDKMPVNITVQGLYNVIKPSYQADWDIRLNIQLLFPEK